MYSQSERAILDLQRVFSLMKEQDAGLLIDECRNFDDAKRTFFPADSDSPVLQIVCVCMF